VRPAAELLLAEAAAVPAVLDGLEPAAFDLPTDAETFVRLCGGRRPDPARYELAGADPGQLVLFT
jgi:hypothetical protein